MQKRVAYIIAAITPVFIVLSYYKFVGNRHIFLTVTKRNGTHSGINQSAVATTYLISERTSDISTRLKIQSSTQKFKNPKKLMTTASLIKSTKYPQTVTTGITAKGLHRNNITTKQTAQKITGQMTRKTTRQTTQKTTQQTTNSSGDIFSSVNENMTIVTAYFNLGTFQKGYGKAFTSNLYFSWTKTFAYLVNPLVVYTDSVEFEKLMKKHREKFPLKTVILRIERNSLWAFQLRDQIKSVYSQPGYPKHHPNTVIPEYSCAQHAKYAVVADAVRRKCFNTEFYAWLDIGYFRDIVSSKSYFRLNAPYSLDRTKIAMNRVYSVSLSAIPRNIIRHNIVWVGGGMFIGTRELVLRFEKLYQRAVKYFLSQKLMNTDQQVLYSMYSKEGRKALKPEVELQLFIPNGQGNPWFYQGYLCRQVLSNIKIH